MTRSDSGADESPLERAKRKAQEATSESAQKKARWLVVSAAKIAIVRFVDWVLDQLP